MGNWINDFQNGVSSLMQTEVGRHILIFEAPIAKRVITKGVNSLRSLIMGPGDSLIPNSGNNDVKVENIEMSKYISYGVSQSRNGNGATKLDEAVYIINMDKGGTPSKPLSYESIKLPFVPEELSINPDSRFASIPTIGRNLNYYHYNGSEKTIEFEIDWYAFDELRLSVIEGCRKIEALSMANGYKNDPPRVMVKWGGGDSLFSDSIWVVLKAPYKLSQFSKATIVGKGKYRKNSLLPIQAKQSVTLGKVSALNIPSGDGFANLSWDQVTGETKSNNDYYGIVNY